MQTLQELVVVLQKPRIVWLMFLAGDITESMAHQLAELLKEGDYVANGGNSLYRDSLRNCESLKKKKVHFYGTGASDGVHGTLEEANLMIGGEREHFAVIEELFQCVAPD